jgi:hypothetical protein
LEARKGDKGQEMKHACMQKKISVRSIVSEEKLLMKIHNPVTKSVYEFYVNFCPICGFSFQPERLNPEDHNEDKLDMICDSLTTANKRRR